MPEPAAHLVRWSLFGNAPNDGILSVAETQLGNIPLSAVPPLHTTIMNSRRISNDIIATVKKR